MCLKSPHLLYFKIWWYGCISQKQKLIRCRENVSWLSWTGITNLIYLIISQPQTDITSATLASFPSPAMTATVPVVLVGRYIMLLLHLSHESRCLPRIFLGFPPRINSALDCWGISTFSSSCQTPSVPQSRRTMKGNSQPGSVCAFF